MTTMVSAECGRDECKNTTTDPSGFCYLHKVTRFVGPGPRAESRVPAAQLTDVRVADPETETGIPESHVADAVDFIYDMELHKDADFFGDGSSAYRDAVARGNGIEPEALEAAVERVLSSQDSAAQRRINRHDEAVRAIATSTPPGTPPVGSEVVVGESPNLRIIRVDAVSGGAVSGDTVDGLDPERVENYRSDDIVRY